MINTTIGKYKIIRLIGEGGMASVYEAEHEMLGTKVAIKVLNPILSANTQIKERFRNEAKVMASLNHPNITKVIDYDERDQGLSITMELLNGEDLSQKIKRDGPLSENEVVNIFTQILSAFQYAHEEGVIHRDIKPSNIFILPNGQVKILDFGIAKLFGQGNEMTQTGTQMGTPVFMSPEQVKGEKSIDHRSDIYSLGVTLFFAINGKPPYDADNASQFDIFNKIVYESLPATSAYGYFNDLVNKACQKERDNRFQSCQEWLEALERKVEKPSIFSHSEKSVEINNNQPEFRKVKFNIKYAFIGLVSVLVLISLSTNWFKNGSREKVVVEWVSIPSGTFMMGSDTYERMRGKDETQHEVTLNAFKISKYEVTFDQYDRFCEATGRTKPDDEGWGRGDRPVINVSWEDANAFAKWNGCRLPTEAEWEYAARAGTTTRFYTGDCINTDQANYNGRSPKNSCLRGENRQKTQPVGLSSPNAWGLYDMHGNVWEWCEDWYGRYDTTIKNNPRGPASSTKRVRRGGSWRHQDNYCRSANRFANLPEYKSNYIGFRIVTSD